MIQLVYSSTAQFLYGKLEIDAILGVSRAQNLIHGITGVLLYKSGAIVQALEGEESAVRQLYANIERDSRHRHVTLIYTQPIEQREFPDWSMGFNQLELGFTAAPDGFNPMLVPDATPAVALGRASVLLQTFALTIR